MSYVFVCEHIMCVCVYVGWVGVGGLALNVDCTGIFIVYMYAHLYVFTSILCSHLLFTQGLHCVTYCLFC